MEGWTQQPNGDWWHPTAGLKSNTQYTSMAASQPGLGGFSLGDTAIGEGFNTATNWIGNTTSDLWDSGKSALGFDGKTAKVDADAAKLKNEGLGMNLGTAAAAFDFAKLGLGYLDYKDVHAQNKQTLKASKFNLAQAQKESDVNDAYRASYGTA